MSFAGKSRISQFIYPDLNPCPGILSLLNIIKLSPLRVISLKFYLLPLTGFPQYYYVVILISCLFTFTHILCW